MNLNHFLEEALSHRPPGTNHQRGTQGVLDTYFAKEKTDNRAAHVEKSSKKNPSFLSRKIGKYTVYSKRIIHEEIRKVGKRGEKKEGLTYQSRGGGVVVFLSPLHVVGNSKQNKKNRQKFGNSRKFSTSTTMDLAVKDKKKNTHRQAFPVRCRGVRCARRTKPR